MDVSVRGKGDWTHPLQEFTYMHGTSKILATQVTEIWIGNRGSANTGKRKKWAESSQLISTLDDTGIAL